MQLTGNYFLDREKVAYLIEHISNLYAIYIYAFGKTVKFMTFLGPARHVSIFIFLAFISFLMFSAKQGN